MQLLTEATQGNKKEQLRQKRRSQARIPVTSNVIWIKGQPPI